MFMFLLLFFPSFLFMFIYLYGYLGAMVHMWRSIYPYVLGIKQVARLGDRSLHLLRCLTAQAHRKPSCTLKGV